MYITPTRTSTTRATRARGCHRFLIKENGLKFVINVGYDAKSCSRVELASKWEDVYATVVHPDAKDFTDEDLKGLRSGQKPQVVAIGETGLDYHYDFSPREAQKKSSSTTRAAHSSAFPSSYTFAKPLTTC